MDAVLARLGAEQLLPIVDAIAEGRAVETPQDPSASTHAAKITKAEGTIDWTASAALVHNLVRGLQPWPLASTTLTGERIVLRRSHVASLDTRDARPGTIVRAHGDDLVVACGGGTALQILEIQPEGRRMMSAREFLSGRPGLEGAASAREDTGRIPDVPWRRRVIAPARVAAYETVLAVDDGRADLPTALARARGGLADERDRALAGEIATGAIRWQGDGGSPRSRLFRPSAWQARRRGTGDPAPEHFPAPPPRSRPRVGGRRRRRQPDGASRKAQRRGLRQRAPPPRLARTRSLALAGRAADRFDLDHALAPALARRAMDRALRRRRRPRRGHVSTTRRRH